MLAEGGEDGGRTGRQCPRCRCDDEGWWRVREEVKFRARWRGGEKEKELIEETRTTEIARATSVVVFGRRTSMLVYLQTSLS